MKIPKISDAPLFRQILLAFCQKKYEQMKTEINLVEKDSDGKFTDSKGRKLVLANSLTANKIDSV